MKRLALSFIFLILIATGSNAWWQSVAQQSVGAASGFSIAFTANLTDTVGGFSISYGSGSIGTANSTRIVIAAIQQRGSNGVIPVGNVTLCGVTATSVVQSLSNTSNSAEIWVAPVPTGTTCTVSVNYDAGTGATLRSAVCLFSMIGQSGASPNTASTNVTANPTVVTLTIPTGGFVITNATTNAGSASTPTFSPSGLNIDASNIGLGASTTSLPCGHAAIGTFSGSTSPTVTWSPAAAAPAMSAAAWGP